MTKINDKSIDMILCDLPYGTTACKWDSIIPFDKLWEQYERIIKDNGIIVLTASQPFTTKLINSNIELFKYELIWNKCNPTGHLTATKRPMKQHENILIFYKKQPIYNPQFEYIDETDYRYRKNGRKRQAKLNTVYGETKEEKLEEKGRRYPKSIIKINNSNGGKKVHPTQKPVALFEWLIKTYTNEGNIVLDNCMGSGTTAIACLNTNRQYIGFELNENYYKIAQNRINEVT